MVLIFVGFVLQSCLLGEYGFLPHNYHCECEFTLLFNLMPLFAVSCANIAATQTEKLSQSHKFAIYSFDSLLSSASLDHHQSTSKFFCFFSSFSFYMDFFYVVALKW